MANPRVYADAHLSEVSKKEGLENYRRGARALIALTLRRTPSGPRVTSLEITRSPGFGNVHTAMHLKDPLYLRFAPNNRPYAGRLRHLLGRFGTNYLHSSKRLRRCRPVRFCILIQCARRANVESISTAESKACLSCAGSHCAIESMGTNRHSAWNCSPLSICSSPRSIPRPSLDPMKHCLIGRREKAIEPKQHLFEIVLLELALNRLQDVAAIREHS